MLVVLEKSSTTRRREKGERKQTENGERSIVYAFVQRQSREME